MRPGPREPVEGRHIAEAGATIPAPARSQPLIDETSPKATMRLHTLHVASQHQERALLRSRDPATMMGENLT